MAELQLLQANTAGRVPGELTAPRPQAAASQLWWGPGQQGPGQQGPVSLVGKLICPRTSWEAPIWKPLGSLAVARMILLLAKPVARWTCRQGIANSALPRGGPVPTPQGAA